MDVQQLQPKVDYLYCDKCGKHVACIRLRPGVWEVQCPRCVGECGLCGCSQTGFCFGQDRQPVQAHTFVVECSSK